MSHAWYADFPNRKLALVTTTLACDAGELEDDSRSGFAGGGITHLYPLCDQFGGVDATVSIAVARHQSELGGRASR